MPRGLDHIVHAVRDLDATAEFYRSAGFQVGAHNRHAWGTHNHIVQFPGVFIELVTIGEPERIREAKPRSISFGAFTRDFLARGEGLSMLVLEGKGAREDAEAFRAAGIGDFDVFDFEREAKRPDGSAVKVGFSLAFAADPEAPDTGFFTCQQHYPENFWNAAFQTHTNGATGVAGVVLVADTPSDHDSFLKAFTGASFSTPIAGGFCIRTPRGSIEVIEPAVYRTRFASEPPDTHRGARLAAIRFTIEDVATTAATIAVNKCVFVELGDVVVIRSDAAHGATLVFESAERA